MIYPAIVLAIAACGAMFGAASHTQTLNIDPALVASADSVLPLIRNRLSCTLAILLTLSDGSFGATLMSRRWKLTKHKYLRAGISLCLLLTAVDVPRLYGERNFRFSGELSRETLESYLSRSITMAELYRSPGNLDDDIRMLKNIGAKFVGRSIYLWGDEARIADPNFLRQGQTMAERIHKNDPDVVLQACVFEIVTQAVGQIPVPAWVFQEFGQTPESRNFDYSKMLFPDQSMVDHWRRGSSVPDIRQPETKMWFFFLAASYMNVGIEAIHFGQLDLVGRQDAGYHDWDDLLKHVRAYASKKARRRYVICDAHVPKGGPVVDGRLLLDFHSFPLRPKEVADMPREAILSVGYSDAIYGRSHGGVAPSGWKCDHLPYLVEFDNFGGTRTPGQASQARGPSIFVWGYDEITWLAQQPETYRNRWLHYAWSWLKEHDPDGFLEMPGGRMLTNGPDIPGEGRSRWYFANSKSAAVPTGSSQEETIRAIWIADSK